MTYLDHGMLREIYERQPHYKNIQVLIETGTYKAESIEFCLNLFRELHTIELSEDLYTKARARLGHTKINFHLGDSVKVLPWLSAQIPEPVFFYLDAHAWSVKESAQENPFPLWEELDYLKTRNYYDIIAIDDYHHFGTAVTLSNGGKAIEWENLSRDTVIERLGPTKVLDYMLCNNALVLFMKPGVATSIPSRSTG